MDLDHKTLEACGEGLDLVGDKIKSWGSKKITSVVATALLYPIAEAAQSLKLVGRTIVCIVGIIPGFFALITDIGMAALGKTPFRDGFICRNFLPFAADTVKDGIYLVALVAQHIYQAGSILWTPQNARTLWTSEVSDKDEGIINSLAAGVIHSSYRKDSESTIGRVAREVFTGIRTIHMTHKEKDAYIKAEFATLLRKHGTSSYPNKAQAHEWIRTD